MPRSKTPPSASPVAFVDHHNLTPSSKAGVKRALSNNNVATPSQCEETPSGKRARVGEKYYSITNQQQVHLHSKSGEELNCFSFFALIPQRLDFEEAALPETSKPEILKHEIKLTAADLKNIPKKRYPDQNQVMKSSSKVEFFAFCETTETLRDDFLDSDIETNWCHLIAYCLGYNVMQVQDKKNLAIGSRPMNDTQKCHEISLRDLLANADYEELHLTVEAVVDTDTHMTCSNFEFSITLINKFDQKTQFELSISPLLAEKEKPCKYSGII